MSQATGYIDIYNICKERIQKGETPSGDRLPSIRELAKSYGVSALTAQRAFAKLQQEGFIRSNGRHGCIVVGDWQERSRQSSAVQGGERQRLALNIGLVVGWNEGDIHIFPPLLSIERMLTSRIYENGGTISRFVLKPGGEGQLIESALKSSCKVFFLLSCDSRQIKEMNSRLEQAGSHCIAYSGSMVCDNECDTICVDEARAFKEISKSLFKMGHRKIAFAGLDPAGPGHGWVEARIEGWKNGIGEMGAKASPGSIYLFKKCEEVKKAVKDLRRHTAVVCANDQLAVCTIEALRAAGVRVPQDVSVTGYDNLPQEAVQRELTTVLVPDDKIISSFMTLAAMRLSDPAEMGERSILLVRPIIIPRSSWRDIEGA